jgi:hypothetical protein
MQAKTSRTLSPKAAADYLGTDLSGLAVLTAFSDLGGHWGRCPVEGEVRDVLLYRLDEVQAWLRRHPEGAQAQILSFHFRPLRSEEELLELPPFRRTGSVG